MRWPRACRQRLLDERCPGAPITGENMINRFFEQDLKVVNVGLASFAESIGQAGGMALHLDWRPPASGNRETGMRLAMLVRDPEVEAANKTAHERFLSAQPILLS